VSAAVGVVMNPPGGRVLSLGRASADLVLHRQAHDAHLIGIRLDLTSEVTQGPQAERDDPTVEQGLKGLRW
jgi:hypothetical protein